MLTFDLKLSDTVIGRCEIVRTQYGTLHGESVSYSTDPDSINVYRYSFTTFDHPGDNVNLAGMSGFVEHRYGDDAYTLLMKALMKRARYQTNADVTKQTKMATMATMATNDG